MPRGRISILVSRYAYTRGKRWALRHAIGRGGVGAGMCQARFFAACGRSGERIGVWEAGGSREAVRVVGMGGGEVAPSARLKRVRASCINGMWLCTLGARV